VKVTLNHRESSSPGTNRRKHPRNSGGKGASASRPSKKQWRRVQNSRRQARNSLDDNVRQFHAEKDAEIDALETKLEINQDLDNLHMVVNRNQFDTGGYDQKRTQVYSTETNGVILVQGYTRVQGRTISVIARTCFWDGDTTKVKEQSHDGLLYWVEDHEWRSAESLFNIAPVYIEERMKLALRVTMDKLNLEKAYDQNAIIRQATAIYKRRYTRHPSLCADLSALVNSPWFYEQLQERELIHAELWEQQAISRIRCVLGRRGLDFDIEYQKALEIVSNGGFFNSINMTQLAVVIQMSLSYGTKSAALLVAILHALRRLMGVKYNKCFTRRSWRDIVYDFLTGHKEPVYPTRRLALQHMLQAFPSHFQMMPASLAWLRKSTVTIERLPGIVTQNATVTTSYDEAEEVKETKIDIFGTTIPGPIVYPESNAQNLHAGVLIRMCQGELANPEAAEAFSEKSRRLIDEMPDFHYHEPHDDELSTFFVSQYGTAKAARLMEMRDDMLENEHKASTLFVKGEPYLGKDEDTFKPRMIWSADELIIAKFSYFFSKLSKFFTGIWDGNEQFYYSNCATPDTIGMFTERMFRDFDYVTESDVSNWDGSLSPCMLDMETYFLTNKVAGLPDIDWLLNRWYNVDGHNRDRTVRVKLNHGRRSGDLWTSPKNSLLNILITMFVYELEWDDDFMMMVLGDDNVVALREPPSHNPEHVYKALGMKCAIQVRESIEHVTYCSGRFWKVGDSYRWGNLPFRMLMKLGMNHHNHPPSHYRQLLYGTAKGMLCTAGHIPIVGSILRAIIDTAEANGIRARVDSRHKNPFRVQGGDCMMPDMDTYAQFSEIYELDIVTIMMLEEAIDCTFDIMNTPCLLLDEIFINGLQVDLETECGVPQYEYLSDEDGFPNFPRDPFVLGPRAEEQWKLAGGRNPIRALSRARQLGAAENAFNPRINHIWLHSLFTLVSLISLDWGVGLHSAFNIFAMGNGYNYCRKNGRRRGRGARRNGNANNRTGRRNRRNKFAASALRQGGQALGNYFAPGIGGTIGYGAGAGISQIMGFGDYTVSRNSVTEAPYFGRGNRSVTMRHREFVQDITGSTAFSASSYLINPGNETLFPWLSGIALSFQQYRIKGLVFYFNSTSADALNSTNTALGTVIMATNYDVNEANYTSAPEMQASYFSTSNKPSEDGIHALECDPSQRPIDVMYINHGGESSVEDLLYNHGNFQLATVGMQAAATIGQLWVSYEIELMKPRFSDPSQANSWYTASAWDLTDIMGDSTTASQLGPAIVVDTLAGTIDLSPWRGKQVCIGITWTGTGLASAGISAALTSGLTALSVHENGTVSSYSTISATLFQYTRFVTVTSDQTIVPIITVDHNFSAGSPTYTDLIVWELEHVNTI